MKLTKKNSILRLFYEDHKENAYKLLYLLSYAIIPFVIGYLFKFKVYDFPVYISGFVAYVSLQCICALIWLISFALRNLFIDGLLMATLMSYMPITKEDLINNNITDLNKWLLLMKYLGDKYFYKMASPSTATSESGFDDQFKESYQVFLDYIKETANEKQEYPDLYSTYRNYLIFYNDDNKHVRHVTDEEYLEFILNDEDTVE